MAVPETPESTEPSISVPAVEDEPAKFSPRNSVQVLMNRLRGVGWEFRDVTRGWYADRFPPAKVSAHVLRTDDGKLKSLSISGPTPESESVRASPATPIEHAWKAVSGSSDMTVIAKALDMSHAIPNVPMHREDCHVQIRVETHVLYGLSEWDITLQYDHD